MKSRRNDAMEKFMEDFREKQKEWQQIFMLANATRAAQADMFYGPRENLPLAMQEDFWAVTDALCRANQEACAQLSGLSEDVATDLRRAQDAWREERHAASLPPEEPKRETIREQTIRKFGCEPVVSSLKDRLDGAT